jgi:hypothetical protein
LTYPKTILADYLLVLIRPSSIVSLSKLLGAPFENASMARHAQEAIIAARKTLYKTHPIESIVEGSINTHPALARY